MAVLTRARALARAEKAALWAVGGLAWTRLYRKHHKPFEKAAQTLQASVAPKTIDRSWLGIFKGAVAKYGSDDASRRGAALSYYTMFSMAPLMLILMAVVGLVMGTDAAQTLVGEQLRGVMGADKAAMFEDMISGAQSKGKAAAGITGLLTLLLGAAAVVSELQSSLNTIWGAATPGSGVGATIKNKLFSMAFVLGLGFLLLVSLVASAALSAVGKWAGDVMPAPESVMQIVNILFSTAVITTLFALMFKVLPKAKVAWKDVWFGALFTAVLFEAGNVLLGLYLGKAGPTSTYGAAGSLLAVMLWAYYCAQILLFGAEFTSVYAQRRGSGVPPVALRS